MFLLCLIVVLGGDVLADREGNVEGGKDLVL